MSHRQQTTGSILVLTLLVLTAATASAADLSNLATVVDRTSHRASSYDRTGGNNDNVMSFEPGQTEVLLDTDGPGLVTHMWFTVASFPGHRAMLRDLVIRMYWEGSEVPSVEVPLGDFFGLGHGQLYRVRSLPINVGANPKALNCYWPMPFYKHARIEVTNVGRRSIRRIYYNLDYELGPIPPNQGLFHAEFRRVPELQPQPLVGNTTGKDNYVILDTQGEGQYVGCFLFVDSAPGGWWGEGDEMMYVDGEKIPSIIGTGTEDYFCEAWGFKGVTGFPFYGVPLKEKLPDKWTQTSVYRFHIPDPVRFRKSLRVTIEHGWHGEMPNDYSSVAYWYQLGPVASRTPLKDVDLSVRDHSVAKPEKPATVDWHATQAEEGLRKAGVKARAITTSYGKAWSGGYLRVDTQGKPVTIPVKAPSPGTYLVAATLLAHEPSGAVQIGLKGEQAKTIDRIGPKGVTVDLGTVEVGPDGVVKVVAEATGPLAVNHFRLKPINAPADTKN